MIVNLHIERLVLDGVAGSAREGALIEAAVHAELTRLWSQAALPSVPRSSTAVPALRGASLASAATSNPGRLGGAIAHSIYGAVAK